MKRIVSLAILLISFKSFHCDGRSMPNARLNFFDIDLLRYAAGDKRGNVMVSPASIRTTLAMLLEGANDVTATEIRNALRLSANAADRKMELITYLNALQLNSTSTTLENANGVFVSKKLPLKKEFETAIKRDFSSEITKMDFGTPKIASDLINAWVSKKTHGLIPTIVEPEQLAASPQMVLTNALYFKSTWKYSFDASRTHSECFYRSDACEKVAMMELETKLPYAYVNDLRAHALELPYEGGRYSMVLIVPLDRDGCEALIRDLPFISLAHVRGLMHQTDVTLSMPKFTVNFNGDMIEPLSKMKINSIFSSTSNLSGIFEANTASVSSFQHKVYVSVDEAGTVAAAVSAAAVVPLSFSGIEIIVDKPFVFFIRDNDLEIVLFEGKIEEPTAFVEPSKAEPAKIKTEPAKDKTEPVKAKTEPSKAKPETANAKTESAEAEIESAGVKIDNVEVWLSKPAVLIEPVKTITAKEPAKPLDNANGRKEVLTPQVLQKAEFDNQNSVTSTTAKSTGILDSIITFFG